MKTRRGFVSNSSSSSFVVLIPNDFEISSIDWSKYFDFDMADAEDIREAKETQTEVIECLNAIKEGDSVWYGNLKYDDSFDLIEQIVKPFVLVDFDTSSDAGEFIGISQGAVEAVLKKIVKTDL